MFAGFVVATLALGIGTTTAAFNLVNAVKYEPLPFRSAEMLATIGLSDRRTTCRRSCPAQLSLSNVSEWTAMLHSVDAIAALSKYAPLVATRSEAFFDEGAAVSSNFFATLGVHALLGRTFAESDDGTEGSVVVLSHAFWVRHFGLDSNVVGESIRFDGKPFRIVGVLPASALVGHPIFIADSAVAQFFVPAVQLVGASEREPYTLVARLHGGASVDELRSEVAGTLVLLRRSCSASGANQIELPATATTLALRDASARAFAAAPYVPFLWAVACVLLVVCSNTSGLFLSRHLARSREFSIRIALGASSWNLIRTFCVEAAICTSIAGILGLEVGQLVSRAARFLPANDVPYWVSLSLSKTSVVFALTLTCLTGAIIGAAPIAVSLSTVRASDLTRGSSRAGSRGSLSGRFALIAIETALAVILVAGAALFGKTLLRASATDLGMSKHGTIRTMLTTRPPFRTTPSQEWDRANRVAQRLAALPEVAAVAVHGQSSSFSEIASDARVVSESVNPPLSVDVVTASYFQALGIPILAGRTFDAADLTTENAAAIIDARTATHLFPGARAIGRRIRLGDRSGSGWMTIVGVVAATRGPFQNDRSSFYPTVYWPATRSQSLLPGVGLVIATRQSSESATPMIRAAVAQAAPGVPVSSFVSIEQQLDRALAPLRLETLVISAFASIALWVGLIGVYALVSQLVEAQARDAAIRIALGAAPTQLIWLIMRPALSSAFVGIAGGLLAAVFLGRTVAFLLYGASAIDPLAIGAAALLLVATVALASLIPARDITRTDPILALRDA